MNRRRELAYFEIGSAYGGNQRWMLDPWMRLGGCAALTTCDAFIYFALHRKRPDLYPYDIKKLTKRDYVKFGMSVKPYLRPRETGIKDLDTYMEGVRIYLEDTEVTDISLTGLKGEESAAVARQTITDSIDEGIPVPYLLLKHQDPAFDFFEWHWFLLNGYEVRGDDFYVKAATYGRAHWLPFGSLWDTGQEEKGGLVMFHM